MLNQQSEKQSSSSTIQNWIALGKLVATDNFAASLFCTAKSIFREWQLVAVPKLWFLHCRLCCRDLGSFSSNDKHSLEEHFWHLAFTTSTVNYHCIVSGFEVDKCATGHGMSNQQSEKQCFPNTTQNWIAFGKLVATDNFAASLFCTAKSIFREWQLVAVPKLWFLHCRLCCRDLGSFSSNDKHSLEE